MKKTSIQSIGFIGFGNMAQAMADGWLSHPQTAQLSFFACAAHFDKLPEKIGIRHISAVEKIESVVNQADLVVIAVKPNAVETVVREALQTATAPSTIRFLSVAAGWDTARYRSLFPDLQIACCIPNTAVCIHQGVMAYEAQTTLQDEEAVLDLLHHLGSVFPLPSHLLSLGGTMGGCTPAFFAMIIEALGDAAVQHGMPRLTAYQMVAEAMAGTALTHLKTNLHPGLMKDAVCSPGGTTIQGVAALEKNGLRHALIQAIQAIEKKDC